VSESGEIVHQCRMKTLATRLLNQRLPAISCGFRIIAASRVALHNTGKHLQVEFTQALPFFGTPVSEYVFLEVIASIEAVGFVETIQGFIVALPELQCPAFGDEFLEHFCVDANGIASQQVSFPDRSQRIVAHSQIAQLLPQVGYRHLKPVPTATRIRLRPQAIEYALTVNGPARLRDKVLQECERLLAHPLIDGDALTGHGQAKAAECENAQCVFPEYRFLLILSVVQEDNGENGVVP